MILFASQLYVRMREQDNNPDDPVPPLLFVLALGHCDVPGSCVPSDLSLSNNLASLNPSGPMAFKKAWKRVPSGVEFGDEVGARGG
jgi:hypothetical protein